MEASFLNFLLLVLSGLGVNWGSLDMIERMPSAFMDFCLFLFGFFTGWVEHWTGIRLDLRRWSWSSGPEVGRIDRGVS